MDLIYIGKLVNTHGINGEVRILSDFEYKSDIFKVNNALYINNKKYIIKSYRHHKIYEMVTLSDVNSIDMAEKLKGESIYIDRNDYNFKGYLNQDLIGLEVYDKDIYKGKVIDIVKSNKYDLLVIDGKRKHMVPNIPQFIANIDLENKTINVNYIKGLDNED